jgi:hypothetical protein
MMEHEAESPFDCLPDDILTNHVLPLVGPQQYRYVAGTNRKLKNAYSALYSTETRLIFSASQASFCFHDIEDEAERAVLCRMAARFNQIDVLRYLRHELNCPCDATTCAAAAASGHLDALQWLREQQCDWNATTSAQAAEQGHLHILQWAREHHCPWDETTCSSAAKNGHLCVLQWARQQGCPWNADTCSEAARHGHLDVVRWVYEHLGDYHMLCVSAAAGGQLHILQWWWGQENDFLLNGL